MAMPDLQKQAMKAAGKPVAPKATAGDAREVLLTGDVTGSWCTLSPEPALFKGPRFYVPWSKAKTWEGTAAVAFFSALGIALTLRVLDVPVRWGETLILGVLAAVSEALAPRAWDNLAVPAAVFAAGLLMT